MRRHSSRPYLAAGMVGLAALTGCEDLPGTEEQQGAVIGGAGGAAAGAAIAQENRLLGALIGGLIGAGGGYLIGANWEKITGEDEEGAAQAVAQAQQNPATPDDVAGARTADLNNDGFVTTDELVAMEVAGLSDGEIISRLEATDQVFELTVQQEDYLLDQGVSPRVVRALENINQEERQRVLSDQDVIGRSPDGD